MRRFLSIFCIIGVVCMVSCKKNSSTTTLSSVAQLTTFSFAAVDSLPGLAEARFTVKEMLDTGFVYNEDSIRYGTPLTKVVPKFTFAATPSSATLTLPDTSIALSGSDTINLTRQPAYLTVVSQDGTNTKVYRIEAYVHTMDPYLWMWKRLSADIYTGDFESQALPLGEQFVLFTNNGFRNHVLCSTDGAAWTDKGEPTLPTGCRVRGIISDTTTLYYTEQNVLYTSTDGQTWTSTDYTTASYRLLSMLMVFDGKVWLVIEQTDGSLYLATVSETTVTPTEIALDEDFPIDNFATVCFTSASNRARALVLGGYSRMGASLNSRWSLEAYHHGTVDSLRVKNLTIEQPAFTSLTGAAMVWYGDQLMLFGGINADAKLQSAACLVSTDEGMTWSEPDTAKFKMPAEYGIRQKQSAIVRNNNVYLFGGQNGTQTYSDVYSGRLNSIDWPK